MTELGPIGDVVIYPSSWYYNACVQGFLEVLAWGLGENGNRIIEEEILQNDGRAIIPGDLARAIFSTDDVPMPPGYAWQPVPEELKELKRIGWWWASAGYSLGYMRKADRRKSLTNPQKVDSVCGSLFHFQYGHYPNLAQPRWDKVEFLNGWFFPDVDGHKEQGGAVCSFCGQSYTPDTDARMYDVFFTRSISLALGDGPDAFPNRFWNNNPSLTTCRSCRSYFLCFHLIQRNRFFVNSDSLRVNWHLNRLLSGKLRRGPSTYQTALLEAIQYDPQLRRGVSNWGLQDLEILVLDRNKVTAYPVSPRLARMFLVPQISSNIGRISNQRVWDVVLAERIQYIPTIIYKSLRAHLTRDNSAKDPDVVYSPRSIEPIVTLTVLCAEIMRFLMKERGDKGMDYVNVGQLRRLGVSAPLARDDNLIFRLLELTRLNRKADVYHLLLRVYVARNLEFPYPLAKVFSIEDPGMFKTGIYAYISGLAPGSKAEAGINPN